MSRNIEISVRPLNYKQHHAGQRSLFPMLAMSAHFNHIENLPDIGYCHLEITWIVTERVYSFPFRKTGTQKTWIVKEIPS